MNMEPTKVWCLDCGFRFPTAAEKDSIVWTECKMLDDSYLFCEHWTPEYWVKQGYDRLWGDAAVNNWPYMEVLRKQEVREDPFARSPGSMIETVRYLILSPLNMRRPVEIYASGQHVDSWGSY